MRYYTAVIHKDEGGTYGLTFPELPGCFAAADDWNDLPAAAVEALDLWFEEQPDVEPADLDTVREREDVTRAIDEGAVLMPVPY